MQMSEENQTEQNVAIKGASYWDNIDENQLPFFNPTEEKKKEGLPLPEHSSRELEELDIR